MPFGKLFGAQEKEVDPSTPSFPEQPEQPCVSVSSTSEQVSPPILHPSVPTLVGAHPPFGGNAASYKGGKGGKGKGKGDTSAGAAFNRARWQRSLPQYERDGLAVDELLCRLRLQPFQPTVTITVNSETGQPLDYAISSDAAVAMLLAWKNQQVTIKEMQSRRAQREALAQEAREETGSHC
jgi:hypothetical protein